MELTVRNRKFTVEPTGLKHVPYNLVTATGVKYTVVRNQVDPRCLTVHGGNLDGLRLTDRRGYVEERA